MAADDPTDGGVTGTHKVQAQTQWLVAPALRNERNVIRLRPIAVACARFNRRSFDDGTSLMTPSAKSVVLRLAQLCDAHPGARLSVFGHSDPTGDDERSKVSSDRRAMSVHALLTRDVAVWEGLYAQPVGQEDNWEPGAAATILAALPSPDGEDYFEAAHRQLLPAIAAFQRDHGLVPDRLLGPTTRSVLFSEYMDTLCALPGGRSFRLEPARVHAVQGCSEHNPVVLPPESDDKAALQALRGGNDRVMVFLLRSARRLPQVSWPCPRVGDSPAACRAQFWPDGDTRRRPTDVRRTYGEDRRTMACRFYDFFAHRSPCAGEAIGPPGFLVVEWPDYLTPYLAGDLMLRAEVGGETFQKRWADLPLTADQFRRFEIGPAPSHQPCTLVAVSGSKELRLFDRQPCGVPLSPHAWEHRIEEMLLS